MLATMQDRFLIPVLQRYMYKLISMYSLFLIFNFNQRPSDGMGNNFSSMNQKFISAYFSINYMYMPPESVYGYDKQRCFYPICEHLGPWGQDS